MLAFLGRTPRGWLANQDSKDLQPPKSSGDVREHSYRLDQPYNLVNLQHFWGATADSIDICDKAFVEHPFAHWLYSKANAYNQQLPCPPTGKNMQVLEFLVEIESGSRSSRVTQFAFALPLHALTMEEHYRQQAMANVYIYSQLIDEADSYCQILLDLIKKY